MNVDELERNGDGFGRHVLGFVPGVGLLGVCALLSWAIAAILPVLDALLLAIGVGFALSNVVGVPTWARRGVDAHTAILGGAIVLMGSSLTVDTVLESGVVVVLTVCGVAGLTLVTVEVLSRNLFELDAKLTSLLAAGSSICGVSAIVAVAGGIRAEEDHVVYAAATILLFDALTLVTYPTIGTLLSLPEKVFGIWAGVSMFSTGPVVAAGFTHSEVAGQWATVTKLTRNAFIGVIVVGYASYYARTRVDSDGTVRKTKRLRELWNRFPKFVGGFVVVMGLASIGAFTDEQVRVLENTYYWLFLLAFVGLGTELQLSKLRRTGVAPVLVVLATFTIVSVLSLLVLLTVFA